MESIEKIKTALQFIQSELEKIETNKKRIKNKNHDVRISKYQFMFHKSLQQ